SLSHPPLLSTLFPYTTLFRSVPLNSLLRLTSPRSGLRSARKSFRTWSCLSQQGVHESFGEPVLVSLRRPAALAHQHAEHISSGKHPEDIPRGPVGKPWPKRSGIAQEGNHAFLFFVA